MAERIKKIKIFLKCYTQSSPVNILYVLPILAFKSSSQDLIIVLRCGGGSGCSGHSFMFILTFVFAVFFL